MADTFSTIRERLHSKSHDYFVFAVDRWNLSKRNMFYGATDALLDGSQAAADYENAISSNLGVKLLACYGFLQALYIEQDAVQTLSKALDLDWNPNNDNRLKEIRDIRNRLCGHPALAGKQEKPPRLSSAIIPYQSISRRGFRGHIYFEDKSETIEVEVAAFRTDNEQRLAIQMLLVEKTMDDQERQFRTEHAIKPFSLICEKGFDYLIERLHCALNDQDRAAQAETHAQMIRGTMLMLETELTKRGFVAYAAPLKKIFAGIDLLDSILKQADPTEQAQHKFDLIYGGLEREISYLRKSIAALDEKLASPP